MAKEESRRLGRGLGALLGEYLEEAQEGEAVREIALAAVRPNPFQPRRDFGGEALAELAASIRENGLLQPLVVRAAGAAWELVAGERRLRALQMLEWEKAPAVVRELADEQMLIVALVENLQRAALSPLEEAAGYQQLIDGFGLTQGQVAERMGRDRSTVANSLRLLSLPRTVQEMLGGEKITAGHARAILGLKTARDQTALAREVVAQGLSVRDTERRVRTWREPRGSPARRQATKTEDPVARRARILLERALGTRVTIRLDGPSRGEIRIPFRDPEDFRRLMTEILREDAGDLFE
ncbi:MAG: ParB/RepB/Spo0J family partition protein [Gemmatimonadota bacterium]